MATHKRQVWHGSWALRGGKLHDKHGNVRTEPVTYRNNHNGSVVDKYGNYIGQEPNFEHHYSSDPKKAKRPQNFIKPSFTSVRQNRDGSLKNRRGHIRRLR